jgi:hypothetical protein
MEINKQMNNREEKEVMKIREQRNTKGKNKKRRELENRKLNIKKESKEKIKFIKQKK